MASGDGLKVSDDEAADIAVLAKDLGISFEEGLARYGGQSAFLNVVTLAETVAPETFAAAEWLPEGSVHGWISFTEAPPKEIERAIAQLPYRISVRTDAVQSARDADQALSKAHEYVLSLGLEDFDLGFNVELDSLRLSLGDAVATQMADSLRAALDSYVPSGVRVVVDVRDGPGLEFQDLRGGVGITWTGAICTSGFTAKRGTTWGVITAGHCNTSSATLDGSASALSNVTGATGSGGDARYYSSADTTRRNQIRIANSGVLYRTITGKTTIPAGSAVCISGIMHSAVFCATVTDVNQCYGGVCKQNKTSTSATLSGDSGGSWYWENSAVGIHTGLSGGYAIYTLIANAESLTGATVYAG